MKRKPVEGKKARKEKPAPKPEYTESGGLDYSVYYMKKWEWLFYVLLAGGLLFAAGYIFYRNFVLSLLLALFGLQYPRLRTRQIIAQRRRKLTLQFKDMLYSLSSAISSGSSAERAVSIALNDMERQYVDPDTHIIRELELMSSKLELGVNIEQLFDDFGRRSGIEDIRTFANIFEVSKRTGGNLIQIIRQASGIITEKIETKMEIDTLLAEKKMEQKVLTVVPFALVLIISETTEGFLDPIFTTPVGFLVSTAALALIGVGYLWGKKLTDISI